MAQRKRFRIPDFSGGLNPDQHPLDIEPNQATEILNLRLDRVGSLRTRHGYSRLISAPHTEEIQAIGRWKDPALAADAARVLLKDGSGDIVWANVGTDSYDVLHSGLDAVAEGDFYSAQNLTVYFNGEDLPVMYDGTDVKSVGIAAPAAAPTLGTTSGSLSGVYQYVYTYFDSDTGSDSNPSAAATTGTLSSQGVTVGVVASNNPRVTNIRLWRTEAGGSTFNLLSTHANATATLTDDGSTPLTLFAVRTDRFEPIEFENMAYVKGVWFGSKGKEVWWSAALDIDAWSPLRSTEVPFEGNDIITALWSYRDTLLIFGRRNLLLLAGSFPNFQIVREDVAIGVCNRRSITEVDGTLVFLSFEGLRTFPGYEKVASQIDRVLQGSTCVAGAAASLIHVPEERALWISLPGINRVYNVHIPNQAVSLYSLGGKRWLERGRTAFGLPAFLDTSENHVNVYGGSTDDGDEISFSWKSKIFSLENPEHVKFVRRIGAFATTGSTGTVTVTISDSGFTYPVLLESTGDSTLILWDDFFWAYDEGAEPGGWVNAEWSTEGVEYFVGSLPANTLIGRNLQVSIAGNAATPTEVVAPISLDYRESDRFLGQ